MARKKRKKPASGRKKRSGKGGEGSGEAAHEVPEPTPEPTPEPGPGSEDQPEDPALVDRDAEEPAVLDLDDDVEEPAIPLDLDDDADVAALIAETVATARPADEPDEPEPPLIDLDAGAGSTPPLVAAAPAGPTPVEPTAEEAMRQLIELGPVSSPEVRDRLLAEALAHAEHKDARYRVPYLDTPSVGRWKALVGVVILFVAGLVAVVPPGWARPDPPVRLSAPERADGLRLALLLQAEQVEAFRVREQRLPDSLAEVAGALPGLRYVRSGTRAYQLIAYLPDGSAIVYDSASPTEAFGDLGPGWRSAEGAS